MLPAKFSGFASRVGRLALRALSWHKASERDAALNATSSATSGATVSSATSNTDASVSAYRPARTSRTFRRAILAFFVAAATLLAMLIVPPVNRANGWDKLPSQAYWDAGGTGYATGSDFDVADAVHEIQFYNPDVTIENGRTKITWTVLLNTESKFFESMSTGKKMEGDISADGKAWHYRPLLMAFLPKGLDYNSIRIDRRKTGYIPSGFWGNFGCFNREDEWKAKYPNDNFVSKVPDYIKKKGCRIQSLTGSDGVHMNQKVSDFTGYNYHHSIYDSDGGSMFNTYWEHTIGEDQRDGLGYCQPDKKGRDLCELKNWKNKFSTVVASWEYNDDALYEWKISAYVNNNVKHPELLPIIAGWHSQKTNASESDFGATEYNKKKATDGRRRKWAFLGSYDFDGDGIPDYIEFYKLHTDWTKSTEIKYPQYSDTSGMMSDYADKHAGRHGNTSYGGKDNVPVTTYGEPVTVKPYVNTGSWYGWDTSDWVDESNPIIIHENGKEIRRWSEKDHFGVKHVPGKATDTTTDLPIDLPGSDPDSTNYVNMKYELTEVPKGVKRADKDHCSVTGVNANGDGCVSIDSKTGYITYNPGKLDRTKGTIDFKIKITHPNPSSYPYHCNKQPVVQENVPIKIKVVSNAMLYNPHYDETTVAYDPSQKKFNPTDSKEPKSVRANNKPWVRVGNLPKGSTFKLEKYGKYGSPVLDWSKIDSKNTGNGKVTFSPSKTNAGKSEKTPVLVTYPDGSTSQDSDAGNFDKVVYAPVKVGDLPISGGDLNIGLYDGTSIDNNGFWGFSFRDKTNPHEIDKGKKLGLPDKDHKNPNKGIVFDSWAKNGKGPITFRVICHRTDDPNSPFALLKPKEGNEKASGEINGLHFEDFRQWIRDNDKKCKGKDCSNDNLYLHSREYDNNTMERSRAMIGGTPNEGGSYECKVFAFHEKPDDKKLKDYSGSLKKFDDASAGGSIALSSLFVNYESVQKDQKGLEWIADSFYFKIKLKDNQKYNPTYVKIPTIQAGKSIKDGRYSSPTKDSISTDQPKSTKAGNGVPKTEQASILDGKDLPDGTWFEIKKLIKKVNNKDPKDFPEESVKWSRFEDGEDNVKRDEHGNPVKNNGKVVPLDQPNRDYGSVTFHPDKWQSAGEYWAEVRVHYPDGSVSDGEGAVNEKHPVYAKVNVTPKPDKNKFGLDLYKTQSVYGGKISVANGINLHPGDLLSGNDLPMFDSYLTNAIGNLHQHMICSKQSKDGKQTDYTYGILPGHVNNENSQDDSEKDGLRLLEPQTIWKHASLKNQFECNANGKKCKSDTHLYDDWVDSDKSYNTFERTHGSFGGVAQKTGDYVCKVYVIKGDAESNKFESAVKANIANNKKARKDVDPVDGVLNASGNPYGTEGVGYKADSFSVHIHRDNQKYNPTYTKMPTIESGSTFDKNLKKGNKAEISSDAPQSKKKVKDGSTEVNANGVSDYDLQNVEEGALPAGTWYEIKQLVRKVVDKKDATKFTLKKEGEIWSQFEDGEDNKADGKQEAKDSNATGKGSVTFRPDKWQNAGEYWAEVRVHYPDGSTSDGDDSINKDHPIYAKVKVTRPAIGKGDLHLNIYKQYENGKFTGYVDDVNGITVMKGVGLLKDMGIDSWSIAKREGITLRALCRDDSDEAKKNQPQVWSENLDNLFFKLNWQQAWKYPTFARQEACRKGSNNGDGCNTGDEHLLFDSTRDTMERARGTITSDKAPTKSGKYYCVVLAMKTESMNQYNKALWKTNGKISVTNNNFAAAIGFTGKSDEDYAVKFFPVHVVDKFALPKTGGEGMSMALLVVAMIGMCVMCGAFFVDQTKWGHAMLAGAAAGMMCGLRGIARGIIASVTASITRNSNTNSKISEIWRGLVKKVKDIRRFDDYSASAKDFVRKATGWLRAALRRVGRWVAERWRCR